MRFRIFGLGAIGSNLLMQLVHLYPKAKFIGIDKDKVEERNIATQAYYLPHIQMFKVQAMQIVLSMKTRSINYMPIHKDIDNSHDSFIKADADVKDCILIDCFDNHRSRKFLEGINNCIHVGFSPKYTAEIIWGKNYTAPGDINPAENDICELEYAVPFINYVVSLACMSIQDYVNKGEKNNYLIIDKFKIRKL